MKDCVYETVKLKQWIIEWDGICASGWMDIYRTMDGGGKPRSKLSTCVTSSIAPVALILILTGATKLCHVAMHGTLENFFGHVHIILFLLSIISSDKEIVTFLIPNT